MPKRVFPLGSCLIEEIGNFGQIDIPARHSIRTHSTPGHLIQLIREGNYPLKISGHAYHPKKGDIIYYYESEEVLWQYNEVPVSFYTLGFFASRLEPLSVENKVFAASKKIKDSFKKLDILSKAPETAGFKTQFYSETLSIVAEIIKLQSPRVGREEEINPWRKVEKIIRKEHKYQQSLSELSAQSGFSESTLRRACHLAFDKAPIKRLREIRLDQAVGFLQYSPMSISQIAQTLGYGRLHEFSREFSKFMGMPPTEYRKRVGDRG